MHEPDSLDRRLGARLQHLRQSQRISLAVFAQQIGVSCPEAQAYEKGTRRIPARVLRRAAEVLDQRPIDLFRDLAVADANQSVTPH